MKKILIPVILLIGLLSAVRILFFVAGGPPPPKQWADIAARCEACQHEFTIDPQTLSAQFVGRDDFKPEWVGRTNCPKKDCTGGEFSALLVDKRVQQKPEKP